LQLRKSPFTQEKKLPTTLKKMKLFFWFDRFNYINENQKKKKKN